MTTRDPWEVLGVDPGLGVEAAKRSWRQLVVLYHPDRHQGTSEAVRARASAMLQEVNAAWDAIKGLSSSQAAASPPSRSKAERGPAPRRRWPKSKEGEAAYVDGMVSGSGLLVPDGSRAPLASPPGDRSLPSAPEPNPNVLYAESGIEVASQWARRIARSLGWRYMRHLSTPDHLVLDSRVATLGITLIPDGDMTRLELVSQDLWTLQRLLVSAHDEALEAR